MDLTHKIVRRLLRDRDVEFSRNQNFDAYEDPRVKRAMRIFRHLQSVERDLLALGERGRVELDALERTEEQVVVRLAFSGSGGRRTSFLSPAEWELLLENDRVSAILRSLLEQATTESRELIASIITTNG